jgi:hypothetical protein
VAANIQRQIGGEIKQITNSGAGMGKCRGQDTEWLSHTVVVKDGRVFDAFGDRYGVPIAEYKDLWQFKDIIEWPF